MVLEHGRVCSNFLRFWTNFVHLYWSNRDEMQNSTVSDYAAASNAEAYLRGGGHWGMSSPLSAEGALMNGRRPHMRRRHFRYMTASFLAEGALVHEIGSVSPHNSAYTEKKMTPKNLFFLRVPKRRTFVVYY